MATETALQRPVPLRTNALAVEIYRYAFAVTLAVVIALIVDFLLLPALLMIGHRNERRSHDSSTLPQARG